MDAHYQTIRELIGRARARWRNLTVLGAAMRAALAVAVVVAVALALSWWIDRPLTLAIWGAAVAVGTLAAIGWAIAPLRHIPSDLRVARFIEEHASGLDDRLVTAVDVMTADRNASPVMLQPMLADAAARASRVDLDDVVSRASLRRATLQAGAAALVAIALVIAARGKARQAYDAAALLLFPEHVTLDVSPGNARVKAGAALTVAANLAGNRAPVAPELQVQSPDGVWRPTAMTRDRDGRFRVTLESVAVSFTYRVAAGPITSPAYKITVAHAPRVARIDVDYTYPANLGLRPRTEEDGGDIYAPAGTSVRLRIRTDRPIAAARLNLADGKSLPLAAEGQESVSATMKIVEDGSYRVALTDAEGLSNAGDTEYFIRTLEDRPPEVHIVKPASDRSVNRLDEVDIEAQADDDYGIERLELVYSVRGGAEKSVPFDIPRHASSVTGRRTLYLEDLDVHPGDFVSYYVRAHDLSRGKRSSEGRSDIFFLEIKPFEQEFAMAQSQSMAGSGYSGSIDDLINAQKQVVVVTWKLDRRGQSANGAQSAQDVHSVARTEAELKARVEQTSSSFRESTMRDPRRRRQPPDTPKVGESMAEEDAMAAAAEAMGRAITSLDALKTGPALPPEMEALNHLLKAQADVKRRQVARQQAGAGGPGNNNRNYDVSTLFDKELQRAQQTNYETPNTAEQKQDANASALDKIRDLAKRQDELLRKQEELARRQLTEEEMQRELEKLTREQNELRQKVEDLARQTNQQNGRQNADNQQQSNGRSSNSQPSNGQQSKGQASGNQQSNSQASSGQQGGAQTSDRMREISEEMRSAAGDLRRRDSEQARTRGSRALDKLRDLERQMQAATPDDRRRALGDMQLESRQLADAQRQVASELAKAGEGAASADRMRQLAGEQDRLAERAKRLEKGLKQQAAGAGSEGRQAQPQGQGKGQDKTAQTAGDAARELDRQRLADRMQSSADELRTAASSQAGDNAQKGSAGDKSTGATARRQASSQQDIAKALDKLADRLGSSGSGKDADARRMSEQMARIQETRDRMNALSREMQRLGQQNGNASSGQKSAGNTGRSGQGQNGGGAPGGSDLARLREEYARQLKQAESLVDEMRREDPNYARGGGGFTFEGQGMTLSAPGTEAFKQDFSKWEDMRRQATTALDRAEAALSKKLQAQLAKDRLAAGVEDKAPPEYQKQVDSYFKAIAAKKKP